MTQLHSFYRVSDGTVTGDTYAGQDLENATPAGCLPMPGRFNPVSQRVDLETGEVISWRAPAPTADDFTAWSWDEAQGRWVPGMTQAGMARAVRAERDQRLAACDWVTLRALELAQQLPAEWAAYRAALRGVPDQPGFPDQIDWPAAPG